jgi:serpin B
MKHKSVFLSRFYALAILVAGFTLMFCSCNAASNTPPSNTLAFNRPRLAPSAPEADLTEIVSGNNAFTFDLYHAISAGEDNLICSPFTLSQALAMVYGGARGKTAQEMANTLHFTLPQERLHRAFNSLDLDIRSRTSLAQKNKPTKEVEEATFDLYIASAVWGQQDLSYEPEYLNLLAQNYDVSVKLVDFEEHSQQALDEINRWVSESTDGQIQYILDKLGKYTGLVLANTAYFNSGWYMPFDEALTAPEPFHLLDGQTKDVSMMHQTSPYLYTAGEGFQAIELPYINRDFVMDVILPQEGQFRAIENRLSDAWLQGVFHGFQMHEVILTMPKYRMNSTVTDLKDTLSNMGMPGAFLEDADFWGIIKPGSALEIYLGKVAHKAFIQVDEQKTEAAAASVVVVTVIVMSGPTLEPIVMRIDHPFIFLIRDTKTGSILFIGRVMDPIE